MEKIDNKYEVGDWLIYPKHGLGKAIDYEVQTILKKKTEFLVVFFEQERMTLRIPIDKMNELGLRSRAFNKFNSASSYCFKCI